MRTATAVGQLPDLTNFENFSIALDLALNPPQPETHYGRNAIAAAALGVVAVTTLAGSPNSIHKPSHSAISEITLTGDKTLGNYTIAVSTNSTGQETASNIAELPGGSGSCSPYTRAMADAIARGESPAYGDFLVVQANFLNKNPDFNKNMTAGARSRLPYIFDGLGLNADATMADVTANPAYNQGKLVDNLPNVENTLCDQNGVVHHFMDTSLEKGTGVAGLIVENTKVVNGQTILVLQSGKEMALPDNALVADVELNNGTISKMLIGNKTGIQVMLNGQKVFVGCDNILNRVVEQPTVPSTAPEETTVPNVTTSTAPETTTTAPEETTVPNVTTSTAPSTTTTVPGTTTTVPETTTTAPEETTIPNVTTSTAPSTTTTVPGTTTTVPETTTTAPEETTIPNVTTSTAPSTTTTVPRTTTTTAPSTTTTVPGTTTVPNKIPQPPVTGGPNTTIGIGETNPGISEPTTVQAPPSTEATTLPSTPNTSAPLDTRPTPDSTLPPVTTPGVPTLPEGGGPPPSVVASYVESVKNSGDLVLPLGFTALALLGSIKRVRRTVWKSVDNYMKSLQ